MNPNDKREGINVADFCDLKRKLWVEAFCAALSCPEIDTKGAATLADESVEEFLKRFRSIA